MQATQEISASFEIPSYIDAELLNAFADQEGLNDQEEAVDRFEECYAGTFNTLEEWAENLLDETGELNEIPDHLRFYFDFSAYARDCRLNGDIWTLETDAGTAVFWNR